MGNKLIAIFVFLLAPIFVFAQDPRLSAKIFANTTALVPGQSHVLLVEVKIQDKFHAQSNNPLADNLIPFAVKIDSNANLEFSKPIFPEPTILDTQLLGKISVFENTFSLFIPVKVKPDAKLQNLKLKATLSYQICDDKSCFKPNKTILTLDIPIAEKAEAANADLFKDFKPPATQPASKPFTPPSADLSKTLFYYFGIAFLAGLIFNIMPCVLPVLPLKIMGFFESASHDRGKTLLFGASFCAGVTAVFTVMGLFVVVMKTIQWGELFSNIYFTYGMAAVLLFLSIGLFTPRGLKLPTFLYALSPSHDTVAGNLAWGALTAVLSTTCTAPLFPPILKIASDQPHPIALGLMATVGLGMGFPYLVFSGVPELALKFPKTGALSHLVKQMLGFTLVGVAAYLIASQYLPYPRQMWSIFYVAIAAALFLMVRSIAITRKPLPLTIAAVFAVAIPLASYQLAVFFNTSSLAWTPFTDAERNNALLKAKKPVLIEFTASWCLNCQYIEGTVFKDDKVIDLLKNKNVVLLKADLTKDNASANALLLQLTQTGGIPTTVLYSPNPESPYSTSPILLEGIYTSNTLIEALNAL